MAVKTRVMCPHCGRSCALRRDTGGIYRHGPYRFADYTPRPACPGSGLTPVVGPLTDKQLEFARYCYRTGDALPVARMLNVAYPQPDLSGLDLEGALERMMIAAQEWILQAVQHHPQGIY